MLHVRGYVECLTHLNVMSFTVSGKGTFFFIKMEIIKSASFTGVMNNLRVIFLFEFQSYIFKELKL